MDEFNERLSKYDLSETQLTLIRDIRRRGKNKVAAQNCRKRKLDQILSLADEVEEVRKRKDKLCKDQENALAEKKRIMKKFQDLYKHIFEVSSSFGSFVNLSSYTSSYKNSRKKTQNKTNRFQRLPYFTEFA